MHQRLFLGFISIYSVLFFCNLGFAEDITVTPNYLNILERLTRIEESQKALLSEMRARFEAVDKRFEAVDKRFEAVDKRFEAVDKRFEALLREMSQRFESLDKRIDSLDKRIDSLDKRIESLDKRIDSLDKRIDSLDKRIESLEKQISNLGSYDIAIITTLIALIAFIIWDRRTAFEKAFNSAFDRAFEKIEALFQDHIENFHTSQSVEKINTPENESSLEKSVNTADTETKRNAVPSTIPQNIQDMFNEILVFMNQFPEMKQRMPVAA